MTNECATKFEPLECQKWLGTNSKAMVQEHNMNRRAKPSMGNDQRNNREAL
jgi:hypothetical protein